MLMIAFDYFQELEAVALWRLVAKQIMAKQVAEVMGKTMDRPTTEADLPLQVAMGGIKKIRCSIIRCYCYKRIKTH